MNKLVELANEAAARMHNEFGLPLALIAIDTVVAAAGYSQVGEESDAAVDQAIMNVLEQLQLLPSQRARYHGASVQPSAHRLLPRNWPQRCRAITALTAVIIFSAWPRWSHLRKPRRLSHSIV